MRRRLLGLLAVAVIMATGCSPSGSRAPEEADVAGLRSGGFDDGLAPVLAQPVALEGPRSSLSLDEMSRSGVQGIGVDSGSTSTTTGAPGPSMPADGGPGSVIPAIPSSSSTVSAASAGPASTGAVTGAPADDPADDPTATVKPTDARSRSGARPYPDAPAFEAEPLRPLDFAAPANDDAGLQAFGTGDDAAPSQGWATFDSALRDLLLRNGNTAASVAVSIGGDVVHSAAFGTRVPGTFTATSVEDRFRIASISKTITAIVLLQLVQDGVVGLDEPIGTRIADHLGMPRASRSSDRLTVRSMLTHTTGYGSYDDTFFGKGAADCREASVIGLSQGGGGGGYDYSNMNFCLAGLAIEALTGRSYEMVVYEKLLTPLGLSGLRLAPTFDPGPGETQHVSTPGRNYMETLGAAGAWIASPTDLVTIFDSLDLTTPGWKPLSEDTLRQMLTPVYGRFGQRGYGMGMILYGAGRYGHTGTIENTHAMVQNRGDGVIWSITVAGPYPDDTPNLEGIIDQAFAAGGFVPS